MERESESSVKRARLESERAETGKAQEAQAEHVLVLQEASSYLSLGRPTYQQPTQIDAFSIDENLEPVYDGGASQLRYYRNPPPHADLTKGFDTYIHKPEDFDPHIDPILGCLRHRHLQTPKSDHPDPNGADATGSGERRGSTADRQRLDFGANFVCFRGLMTKMMLTPYSNKEPWSLAVCLHNGAIYMDELVTDHEWKRRESQQSDRQQQMCYWGYKFEDYCTTATREEAAQPPKPTDFSAAVNDCLQYCILFRTRLNNNALLMAAEVDCIMPNTRDREYVELKTSKTIYSNRDTYSFERFKLLKFWAQSFLAGIPHIVVGFRDDNGIVQTVQKFKTLELPRFVREKGLWDPNVCLAFANQLLDFMRQHVTQDQSQATYVVSYDPVMQRVTLRADTRPTRHRFLPGWYLELQP
eukprot:comp19141_c0_seq1/m.21798 comp19141_c0_seq1/g.21798  ORF comp19141_c0_seq1/g.21798 comp19141_c0_seq1/m.21798 type:complete len:414 (-) comp19141_c0_seq1:255-1496(-)